jgi:catechol 2,3-dioxygenase-like lactoylglutathione lyase family enzyme
VRITTASVLVDDQEKALRFYTEKLGFQKKTGIPTGEHRWLTVVSPETPDGPELVLEPEHPASRAFKDALVADGIPFTSFAVEDVHAEHARLAAAGVRFTQEPAEMGPGITTAVLDDTCGNLIQIAAVATAG